jgi:hypothetical protein
MEKQQTFASVAWTQKGKVTRRERFLAEMDAVIPWADLLGLIEPHYPKAGNGRQPLGVEKMLRIYFVQQWFNLSDPQAEDSLYDSESIRRFVRIELSEDVVPDETTILRFRHLLEQHGLTAKIFDLVKELLTAKRLLLKSGTIVDATIISAPSSTKNASQRRDPEMKQTRKGQQWYFGMKLHIGADTKGRVHSVVATNAATADITQLGAAPGGGAHHFRGPGLLERSRSAGVRGGGGALSNEPPAARPPAAQRTVATHQSRAVADTSERRTSLSHREAALGLRQGAVSRLGEEPRQSADDVCSGQPVQRTSPTHAFGSEVRPVSGIRPITAPWRYLRALDSESHCGKSRGVEVF